MCGFSRNSNVEIILVESYDYLELNYFFNLC